MLGLTLLLDGANCQRHMMSSDHQAPISCSQGCSLAPCLIMIIAVIINAGLAQCCRPRCAPVHVHLRLPQYSQYPHYGYRCHMGVGLLHAGQPADMRQQVFSSLASKCDTPSQPGACQQSCRSIAARVFVGRGLGRDASPPVVHLPSDHAGGVG